VIYNLNRFTTKKIIRLSLFAFKNLNDSIEEIDVKKLSIVDENGNKIMVLSIK